MNDLRQMYHRLRYRLEHPMVLLGDKGQVEASFVPFEDSANLDARSVHGLHRTYHRLGNHLDALGSEIIWSLWNS